MTIRKAPILDKSARGAHAPLFLRITTPSERRQIQTHPCETFLVPNEDSETGGWRLRDVATMRAYVSRINALGAFWVIDSRSDGQGGYLVWLSWNPDEAKRRHGLQKRRRGLS